MKSSNVPDWPKLEASGQTDPAHGPFTNRST